MPEESPPPPLTVSEYQPTTYPGSRAPHAWLGPGRSLIDEFGRGFVLSFTGLVLGLMLHQLYEVWHLNPKAGDQGH